MSAPGDRVQQRCSPVARANPARLVAGVSLVELMVALAVGAVVVLGLTELLTRANASYAREEAFARLQENGRVASTLLAKAMRPTRSTDCKNLAMHEAQGTLTVKACDLLADGCALGEDDYLSIHGALGYDQGADLTKAARFTNLPAAVAANVADRYVGGDVFVAWGIDPRGAAVTNGLGDDGTAPIALASAIDLHAGDLALISNCLYAHVFAVSEPEAGPTTTLSHDGAMNAVTHLRVDATYAGAAPYNREPDAPRTMVYPLLYRIFYVCCVHDGTVQAGAGRDNCRPSASGEGMPEGYRPALCVYDRGRGDGSSQVLVPNVADLRLTYSGDENADGVLDYHGSSAISVAAQGQWASVRSVAVELLLTTEDAHSAREPSAPTQSDWPPNENPKDRLGAGYPPDTRLYQRFRFDVALRAATPWALWE
ncbi:PilW family protein [uncultured Thiohalocapsa sp.]|uniref:PilW family protein n=1 Tax=uncultured Thiohalocapsa sp. TaxID=768990 RepID=UPI0025CBCAA7|nr:PilW family protein [uncultured Thiohalocapsa sp.]